MGDLKFTGLVTLIIAVLSFLLGYGFKWAEYKLSEKRLQLEESKESREMRDGIEGKMTTLVRLSRGIGQETNGTKKAEAKMQFDLVMDDLVTLEKKCAEFEKRQPRDLFKAVTPSAPTGMKISDE